MRSVLAVAMVAIAAAPALAQEPGSRQTREFVQAAIESDTFEIMAAQTALAESTDPKVLAFARQMIVDHGMTSRSLRDAAVLAHLVPPPLVVGAAQAPWLAALQSLRGRAFDQAYWRQQALVHRAALVTEQRYADTGDVPAVRQAAVTALPIVQAHLAMAEQMNAQAANSDS